MLERDPLLEGLEGWLWLAAGPVEEASCGHLRQHVEGAIHQAVEDPRWAVSVMGASNLLMKDKAVGGGWSW